MGFYPFLTQTQQIAGGTIPGNLTVNPGNLTVSGAVNAGNAPGGPLMELVGTNGNAGFSLVNGTPTILTWTAPADGNLHRFLVIGEINVTVAQTGGAISMTYTPPTGGGTTAVLLPGSLGTGVASLGPSGTGGGIESRTVGSGTTVTLTQSSAQTVGTSVLYAEIWAS